MGDLAARGRWRRVRALAIALYALVLVTAPFEHHDLACHLKTPLHCTACASSPLSVHSHAPVVPDGSRLTDAGRAMLPQVLSEGTVLAAASSGRSPPSLA